MKDENEGFHVMSHDSWTFPKKIDDSRARFHHQDEARVSSLIFFGKDVQESIGGD